jgi:transcriptional regulator with XRE-family HTH domain
LDKPVDDSAAHNPRRVFGAMLAYYRTRAGMTPEQLGARVYLSGSQIRKVEAGSRAATEELARACEQIAELGCNGGLVELYTQLRPLFRDRPYPGWFDKWPDVEATARSLRWFEPLVVPGLLQTEAYARAILSTRVGDTAGQIDQLVAGRMDRQQVLDRDRPPTLRAIMDEGVLRRPVGGPDVMRGQAARLCEMARRPAIVIQVIPLSAHQGLNGGGFIIADLPGKPPVAYQDTAARGQILQDGDDIDELAETWNTLVCEAMSRTESLKFMEDTEKQWT